MKNVSKLLLLLIFLFGEIIYSQSMFSTIGLGEIRSFINVRSSGMGNVGLAYQDDISYNRLNPANSARLKDTSFNTSFVFTGLRISQKNNSFSSSLSIASGLG